MKLHVTCFLDMQGLVISCCLICAVLFFSAAWDYMLQYWVAVAPTLLPPLETAEGGAPAQVHTHYDEVCLT